MSSPSRLRRFHLWITLAAIALAGCTNQEDGGVHAIVTLDPAAWPDGDSFVFDHVTVTATSTDGTLGATACLFYSEEPEREVQSDSDAPTACADLHTAAWIGPPTLAGWKLPDAPRTIDFVFPSSTNVVITAIAGLGGRPDVGKAFGVATADVDYPELTLSLAPDVPSIGADCSADLVSYADGFMQSVRAQDHLCLSAPFRDAPTGGASPASRELCVTDALRASDTTLPEGHATAMQCTQTASRIAGAVGNPCAGDDPALVWRSPIDQGLGTQCLDVLVTGHFARCADGSLDPSCALTTECTPPLAEIEVIQKGKPPETDPCRDAPAGDPRCPPAVSFACVPPFAEPIDFIVKVKRPLPLPNPVDAIQDVALFFHPSGTGATSACFFDLYSLAFKAADCDEP